MLVVLRVPRQGYCSFSNILHMPNSIIEIPKDPNTLKFTKNAICFDKTQHANLRDNPFFSSYIFLLFNFCLSVVLQLETGDYPENSYAVFCHKK